MAYRPTDRFENWFITSLQTDVNDTTTSFRLNKALNVNQCRLVIDPYDESKREIVKVTSVDGNLVYVERGDDNTAPEYHNEGTIVALHVIAADLNDLYADWAEMQTDYATEIADMHDEVDAMIIQAQDDVAGFISDVEAAAFLGAHPVGSVFVSTDSADPATTYGGTWVQDDETIERRLVATRILHWSTGDVAGTTTKQKMLGTYGYDLLTTTLNTRTGTLTPPTGWHVEYKMQAEMSTGGGTTVKLFLNNIETNSIQTWSGASFRVAASTDFFKASDVVLETTTGYSNPGINFGWVANNAASVIRVYLPTLSAYFVRDNPIYKWRRTA